MLQHYALIFVFMSYICNIMMSNKFKLSFLNPNYSKTTIEIEQEIGGLLKKYRVYKNIKQEDLAERAGISRSQLVKIEKTGKTRLSTIIEVARVLNCLDKLYGVFEIPSVRPTELVNSKNVKKNKLRVRS